MGARCRHPLEQLGGFIAKLLGLTAYNVIGEVVVATAGAIICLFVWQRIRGK